MHVLLWKSAVDWIPKNNEREANQARRFASGDEARVVGFAIAVPLPATRPIITFWTHSFLGRAAVCQTIRD